ncbi:MarR family transcriptional regulator [Metallibacterium sp.]|uniref:MarR family winged helix-turn-helix transcriptional regulator n=1 Tax=Metallibacterium sp. TaxID=2940281 RepID=UPI002608DC2D|nr:MarR family transcriptional regulator [Metallibacterium sp.]
MNPVCNLPVGAEENLGLLLGLARARIISALEAELAANGLAINHTQYTALKRLAQCGPLAPGELAQALGHDAGAMTRVLDGLEEKGYVRRAPNPDDRRCVRVIPTEAGTALWSRMRGCGERTLARALRDLSETERDALRDLLKRIVESLSSTDTPS